MPTALVNALVVLPPEADEPRITTLRFDSSRILSLDKPPRRGDVVHDLRGWAVYPGLINAHDHLELNHYPRTRFRPFYENAHQWGEDFLRVLDEEPFASLRRTPLDQQCRMGGIKNVRSGVTTVAHHNPLHRPLRDRNFVVRVVQRYGWAHSLHFEKDVPGRYRRTPRGAPWLIHLAEGTDEIAAHELRQLDRLNCLHSNTVLIHGVGLSEEDRRQALMAGAGLVWCPSSNFYLLGRTAFVSEFAAAGRLALGTDSRLTADGDMLDELRAAATTGQLSHEQLFRAVTTDAANLLRLRGVGALLPGYQPDFFIVPADKPAVDPYWALTQLGSEDIEAVFVGGAPRFRRTSALWG
jgi:cytosine/adenosine deaminase-related metal-dependent hydrolase